MNCKICFEKYNRDENKVYNNMYIFACKNIFYCNFILLKFIKADYTNAMWSFIVCQVFI